MFRLVAIQKLPLGSRCAIEGVGMIENPNYRSANVDDGLFIAEMIDVSSDGVALVEWTKEAQKANGRSALDIGAEMYASDDGDYSYKNCWIAEVSMRRAGMLLGFPMCAGNQPISCHHLLTGPMYLLLTSTWRRLIHGISVVLQCFESSAGTVLARGSCGSLGNRRWHAAIAD